VHYITWILIFPQADLYLTRALKTQLADLDPQIQAAQNEVQSMRRQYDGLRTQERVLSVQISIFLFWHFILVLIECFHQNEAKTIHNALRQAEKHLRQLQSEVNEEMPVNIAALEDHKRVCSLLKLVS